jgi:polyribonucleotide nucleotidyltransferase
MAELKKSIQVAGRELTFSTGLIAKQANASILVQYGDTVILATFVYKELSEEMKGQDFVPLTVDYRDRTYAAGKIPGGFFKREGKPKDSEVLASRLIDRPLRPLFPNNIGKELSIGILLLSYDCENSADILGVLGSSLAVCVTGVPFNGPVGVVRVGYIDNQFVVNPNEKLMGTSLLDLTVVGTENKITMIESNSNELSEELMTEALTLAQAEIKKLVQFQKEFIKALNVEAEKISEDNSIDEKVAEIYNARKDEIKSTLLIFEKLKRQDGLDKFKESLKSLFPEDEKQKAVVSVVFEKLIQKAFRELITKDHKRPDGRGLDEIRQISCQVGFLPSRVHGSSLFTRGETQALGTVTLGSPKDEQILDELSGEKRKRFMLHYNFPSFSVGEVKPSRGPGRREIGHGMLAENALAKVLPSAEDFPYTIRVVSDILESNGSSSQASVCAGCLALMHAGVPITNIVAGISVGLVQEEESTLIVDIAGLEDHFGDMDFKVAGSEKGITAIQMDLKIDGISLDLIPKIFDLAKKSRYKIIEKMRAVISEPNKDISNFAPMIEKIFVPKDRIKVIIGSGGQNIKAIVEKTKADINIKDTGEVSISAVNRDNFEAAKKMILLYAEDVKVGELYKVKITKIMNFGAFAEILPGKEGLIHISQLAEQRVERVEDIVTEGQEVMVKVLAVDDMGKVSLSMKQV